MTLSLAGGAAMIWLVGGVATGVLSALRKGSIFDRAAMGVALAGCLVAHLLHRPAVVADLQLQAAAGRRPAAAIRRYAESAEWAYDLILPWITLAFLYAAGYARLTRAGMLETMGEDYIRTARAKGLPRTHGRGQARPAGGADADPHDLRSRPRPAARRRDPDREHVLPAGLGKYAVDAIINNDLPKSWV